MGKFIFRKNTGKILCGIIFFLALSSFWAVATDSEEKRSPWADMIIGEYTFFAEGTWVKTSGYITAGSLIRMMGVTDFHEDGSCDFSVTINQGLVDPSPSNPGAFSFSTESVTCDYTVDSEGRGAIRVDYQNPPYPVLNLPFVIVNENEILSIRTDPEIVASGVFKRRTLKKDEE